MAPTRLDTCGTPVLQLLTLKIDGISFHWLLQSEVGMYMFVDVHGSGHYQLVSDLF